MTDAKTYLDRYGKLKLYISAKQRELQDLRNSLLPKSMDYSGVVVQSSPVDHMADVIAKIDEMERKIRNDTLEALKILREIEDTISEVEDLERQALLTNYYIVGLTWEMTAEVMKYDVRTVYRMHEEALEEVERILVSKCH